MAAVAFVFVIRGINPAMSVKLATESAARTTPVEYYGGRLIAYASGDSVFDHDSRTDGDTFIRSASRDRVLL